jgi:hypothetical protein
VEDQDEQVYLEEYADGKMMMQPPTSVAVDYGGDGAIARVSNNKLTQGSKPPFF